MARDLSSAKQANIEAGATRPIYLVEWQHSGLTEYLSCSGDITYDGQAYTAGGLTISSMEDGKTATILLPATSTRIAEIQNNTWRLGICKITAILAAPGDSPTYAAADGDLMLDGVIEQTTFSGELISVIAKCKYYRGALVPRFTFDDVVSVVPAVGSTSEWEGENYSYEQWLKTVAAIQKLVRPGVNPQVTGRLSTTQVNNFAPAEQSGYKLLTAQGVHIPIVYGRATVPGFIFADGEYSGSKFIGVAWCMGEVFSVEKVFINDAEIPATVTAKHYRGTTTQTVSPALQLYTSMSPVFSDDLILRTPAGNVGICYSVFNIPSGAISGAPRFRAIIQGRMVEDPSSTATDPYGDNVEWSYDFTDGGTDTGPNGYTLTLNGGAAISAAGLTLDGTGDYATNPDGNDIGSQPFSLEVEFTADTAAGSPVATETLICHGNTGSTRSLQVDRVGDDLLLYLSSDGSTWDICSGLSCGSITGGGSPIVVGRLLIERVDDQISTYLDGGTQSGVITSAALFNTSDLWEFGACGGAQEWDGIIKSARLSMGAYRYGSPHAITNSPFSDSGNYTAGVVYSEKPALAQNDLAKNPVFGLGATTTGVQDAVDYGDTLMDSGAPRCRIGLVISEVRLVEQWMDALAMYANCLWFPEGSNIKFVPDKAKDGTNGSGPELYYPTSPEFGSPLPTVTVEDGVSYSVSVEILTASTTSPLTGVSVEFGGVEVITSAATAGVHGALVTASGTSPTIEVIEDGGFDGTWGNLSVKRTHRLITQWLPSTLRLQGAPEGDKPNAVIAKYSVPDDLSGAWSQKTFGVMNAEAAAGEPMVLTTLDLQGVNRIEEASNKAIAALYRNDRKTTVSMVSTDEEVVCQPGDTVQVVSSNRGVDATVWVESNRMVSYGRHQITGIIYRGAQFPSESYTEGGRLNDPEGFIEEPIGGPYEPPPPECYPYECSALSQAQSSGLVTVDAVGSGMWDLLDYQDNPSQIPQYFRSGSGGSGWNLTCTDSLDTWTEDNIKSSVLVPANGDLDVCGIESSPRCCSNVNSGTNSAWWVANISPWGQKLPNVALSAVVRGVWSNPSTYKARIWEGYGRFSYWGESSQTSITFTASCFAGRSADGLTDYLIFNWTRGVFEYKFPIPLNILTGSAPSLLQISLSFSEPQYPAHPNQIYTYAAYLATTTMTIAYSIIRSDGVTSEGSYTSGALSITQVFDRTHGNGNDRPIAEAYKLKSLTTGGSNTYFLGSFGGIYNFSVAHETNGVSGQSMQGGNAGGINGNLAVAFNRNFADYELPEYCEV